MDTIEINAGAALNGETEEKKKSKLSDTAKAAMGAGAAGIGIGVAAKSVIDSLSEDKETDTITAEEEQVAQPAATHTSTGASVDVTEESLQEETVTIDVNPDDVMLEEPVAVFEAEVVATPEAMHTGGYQPFANNDNIGGEVIPEPQLEDVLVAEDPAGDAVIPNEVDVICGLPEVEIEPDSDIYPDNNLLSGNDSYNDSYYDSFDMQSDIMA